MIRAAVMFIFAGCLTLGTQYAINTGDGEKAQLFLNTEPGGYPIRGIHADWVFTVGKQLRQAATSEPNSPGGWGPAAVCIPGDPISHVAEIYNTDGELVGVAMVSTIAVNCGAVDIDNDGDIDLADFALFQRSLSGPRG